MKYVKMTLLLFIVAFIFSNPYVKALVTFDYAGVTIPPKKELFISKKKEKSNDYTSQSVYLIGAVEAITGIHQPVMAQSFYTIVPIGGKGYVELKEGQKVYLPNSTMPGSCQLYMHLKNTTYLNTSFSGTWTLEQ